MNRQRLLRGPDAPPMTFFLEEAALRRPVGGREVIREQLEHVLFMSEWKRVSIRVLPLSVGAHVGIDGSFVLLDNKEGRPVVVLGSRTATTFIEAPEYVEDHRRIIADLGELALSRSASRAFIADVAVEFGSTGIPVVAPHR
jgi:hypothetical protein